MENIFLNIHRHLLSSLQMRRTLATLLENVDRYFYTGMQSQENSAYLTSHSAYPIEAFHEKQRILQLLTRLAAHSRPHDLGTVELSDNFDILQRKCHCEPFMKLDQRSRTGSTHPRIHLPVASPTCPNETLPQRISATSSKTPTRFATDDGDDDVSTLLKRRALMRLPHTRTTAHKQRYRMATLPLTFCSDE